MRRIRAETDSKESKTVTVDNTYNENVHNGLSMDGEKIRKDKRGK
ncbi:MULTISPECIES: hypothetical protein [Bacillus cereus group]|nr:MULTISPECIES: hypothetical protein [Bacillus cereus group]AVR32275.1 hypothetical protein FORC60_2404 [Bacillus cereus]MCR2010217.1 hypothetical protein [Bacillus cereus]QBZ25495.1 hypothetical protein FORC085_2433 [Bacillus cereus]GCF82754.1 hypothetical protein BCACH14_47300 [Bacillus cereus]